jgi:PKD repeat protein
MGRSWLLGIAGMLVISGCIDAGGDSKDAASTSPTVTTTDATSASAPSTSANATNEAPTATVEADNVTGSFPLTVVFTLNGSDPEGDELSWTLSFGDDAENATGSELPANATHEYAAAGNFTVFFEVSDGVNAANMTLAVNVTEAVSAGGEPYVISGSTLIPFPGADALACINDDIDGNIYDLEPAGPGWSYVLEPGDGSFGLYWYSGGDYDSTGTPTGVVPDGMDQVEICNISGLPGSDYSLTLTPA